MDKKKIGIVSYHSDPNYGTMLQAYALHKAINMLGVESEYINYKPCKCYTSFIFNFRVFITKKILHKKSSLTYWDTKQFKSTLKAFNAFHNQYIPCSQYYDIWTVKQSINKYSSFIVGSDQTWSPYMNRMGNTINFLEFVGTQGKKYSYAPSIGTTTVDNTYKQILRQKLVTFNKLSCREQKNAEMLKSLLGKKVEYVIDPTLLLNKNDWRQIAKPLSMPDQYILCYQLGDKECIMNYAEALGKEKGLPVYYVLCRPSHLNRPNLLSGIGPQEWLWLINNANYVVTDSFHGSVFCINFGVNFYSFTKREESESTLSNDNDRILLFLEELSLANRFKKDVDNSFESDIDFSKVHSQLEQLRQSSFAYLNSIIE